MANTDAETSAASLVDILTEAISSTIEADNSATEEYFAKLREYAVSEDGEEIETLDCKVRGEKEGEYYTLKVPKLILMPMPLLHVQEATFDVEGEWEIQENTNTQISKQNVEDSLSKSLLSKEKIKEVMVQIDGLEQTSKKLKLSNAATRALVNESNLPTVAKRMVRSRYTAAHIVLNQKTKPSTETNSESTSNNSQSLKIKVNVKMQQSDIPAGLSNLIQTVTNCIKVEKSGELKTEE